MERKHIKENNKNIPKDYTQGLGKAENVLVAVRFYNAC